MKNSTEETQRSDSVIHLSGLMMISTQFLQIQSAQYILAVYILYSEFET